MGGFSATRAIEAGNVQVYLFQVLQYSNINCYSYRSGDSQTGRGNLLPYVFQGCVLFPLAGEMQSSMCYLYAVCAPIALAALWTFSSEEV